MTLFDEYAAYHRDPRNVLCHEAGIPAIVLALIALARRVRLGRADLAALLIVAVGGFYVRLARTAGAVAVGALVALYLLAALVAWPLALALFTAGWALQFAGHAFEGKKPAFTTNLVHLLVGPLWIVRRALGGR